MVPLARDNTNPPPLSHACTRALSHTCTQQRVFTPTAHQKKIANQFFGPHVGVLYLRRALALRLAPYKLRPSSDELPSLLNCQVCTPVLAHLSLHTCPRSTLNCPRASVLAQLSAQLSGLLARPSVCSSVLLLFAPACSCVLLRAPARPTTPVALACVAAACVRVRLACLGPRSSFLARTRADKRIRARTHKRINTYT